jgi:hypothetical protein
LDIDIDCAEAQLNRLVEDRAASAKGENERAELVKHREKLSRLIDGKV